MSPKSTLTTTLRMIPALPFILGTPRGWQIGMWRRRILRSSWCALGLGVLAFVAMPQVALAKPAACISPGTNSQCMRDDQCCDGSVCLGVCKRGCKITVNGVKTFFDNGAIDPANDCQWCQATVNRFGWTNRATGAACGSSADTACDNPDTCSAGTCRPNYEPTTTTCGDSGTECRNQDYCDGSGGCADNGFNAVTTHCTGGSQGNQCDNDPADHCTGSSNSCVDVFKTGGTSCGDSGTACRNQDTCSGSSGQCVDQGFKAITTHCTGASQGAQCDKDTDDHCAGNSNACVDVFEAGGTSCGDSGSQCRNQDTCSGSSGECTDNGFKSATTPCTGDSQGDVCDNDPADHCMGNSNACVDAFKASGTFCNDSGTECRNQDTCSGTSGECTDNGFKADTTHCTSGVSQGGQCDDDPADHCTGSSNACVDAFKASGTSCGDSGTDCRNQDTCTGSSGTCTDNGFKSSTTHCTGTANAGLCDDNANDHCDGSGGCVDAFKPSTFPCALPRDGAGNYTCTEVSYCTGAGSTCPAPDIGVFDPTIPCREPLPGRDPICDPPEYCTGYGVCPAPRYNDATCEGGPRDGQWCDIVNESPTNPQCGVGHCVATVCPGAILPCEKPWTCTPGLICASNGNLPVGTDCIGDYACEKYSCDATGDCVDQNVYREGSASCRAPANECDVRELCGTPPGPSNGRYDFEDYPACGPDLKKPFNTACTFDFFGQDAPGKCIGGECNPFYCENSIECPDGWICGCPPGQPCAQSYCIPAPASGGYGDVCTVTGYCSRTPLSWDPGRRCTSDAGCRDQTHPDGVCLQSYCDNESAFPGDGCASDAICRANGHANGDCVADTRGDCGSIPGSTFDYVCCSGMEGDGQGGVPAVGLTGRCQECCGSGGLLDQNCTDQDAPDGTTYFQCCDGKCTDVVSDIRNCMGCNYDTNGSDCTELITACNPGVVECDALTVGGGCVFEEYCQATADANEWVAAACEIPDEQVPVPSCDYCTGVFTTTPGKPCLTEEDCGGFTGITDSCYHDPSLFCYTARTVSRMSVPECRTAPYTGCAPTCTEAGNSPNVGEACESDADCQGGTTCKMSCDLPHTFASFCFTICFDSVGCFEDPTCQW